MLSNLAKLQPQNMIQAQSTVQILTDEATPLILNSQESIFQNQIFIAFAVLIGFNILVFILVYCCSRCFKIPYQINTDLTRQIFGQKYSNVKFQTRSYCLIQSQLFYGRDCYQSTEIINNLPAYIYGRQMDAQNSHLDYFTIKQCDKCNGLTKTLEVFKYGKLRQCWQTIFMILISPCFLAFTIRTITSNNILWRKLFCTECGYQKPVQK